MNVGMCALSCFILSLGSNASVKSRMCSLARCLYAIYIIQWQEESQTNREVYNFKLQEPKNPLPNHALVTLPHHDAEIKCLS